MSFKKHSHVSSWKKSIFVLCDIQLLSTFIINNFSPLFLFFNLLCTFFFYFTIVYWFCHTSTCICHGCTHVPHPEPPPSLPSPYHPSGSSQCTSPKHPVSCIEPGLVIHFLYDIIHVLMPSPLFLQNNTLYYQSQLVYWLLKLTWSPGILSLLRFYILETWGSYLEMFQYLLVIRFITPTTIL